MNIFLFYGKDAKRSCIHHHLAINIFNTFHFYISSLQTFLASSGTDYCWRYLWLLKLGAVGSSIKTNNLSTNLSSAHFSRHASFYSKHYINDSLPRSLGLNKDNQLQSLETHIYVCKHKIVHVLIMQRKLARYERI